MGAGCKLMEDSGLDGLWAIIYAKNSSPKAPIIQKTLTACLLTDAALHIYLLQTAKCPISSDLSSNSSPQKPNRWMWRKRNCLAVMMITMEQKN